MMIPVTLKWNKKSFPMSIELGETAITFKERIQTLTGVPMARQKLLSQKGGWKGTLKDDVVLDASTLAIVSKMEASSSVILNVTLIGSAETLSGPTHKTTFLEDLSPTELRAAEDAKAQAAMSTAEGMIPTLQLPPHLRDDHKQEFYEYNRLVTGLPQRQIEQELKYYQKQSNEQNISGQPSASSSLSGLQGKVALQLGLELRRGYVNDLTVLDDGTCVSVLDDGHVQLWKHAAQQQDVIHLPGGEGGVDSVVALNQKKDNSTVAFVTAGRGSLQLWTSEADPILTLPGAMPGTSPASLECVFGGCNNHHPTSGRDMGISDDRNNLDMTTTCLAARFQIIRTSNPSQFRLPPQNDVERQRRAQAEAQELAIQQALAKAARSLQVWFSLEGQKTDTNQHAARGPSLRSQILEPPGVGGLEGSAPITCLTSMAIPSHNNGLESVRLLIAGDAAGGLRFWRVQRGDHDLEFHHHGLFQLIPTTTNDASSSCGVVCMEPLRDGRLAVSTNISSSPYGELLGANRIAIPQGRAVHIMDISELLSSSLVPIVATTLTGHSNKDTVICMCELPDESLLTGGGKMDATLQLWSRDQIKAGRRRDGGGEGTSSSMEDDINDILQANSTKTLTNVGYVFALSVLPDTKHDSNYYAVAAGRYNTVKVII